MAAIQERRSGIDRRNLDRFKFQYLFIKGQREYIRRKEDRNKIFYFDRYSSAQFGVIISILFFSVIDALLTLLLLNHGAYEINPIMAYYLRVGPYTFLAVKYGLTSIGVFFFVILRNTLLKSIKIYTDTIFYFILVTFITVVAWEFYLIFNVINYNL
jgi:hypothetical protein